MSRLADPANCIIFDSWFYQKLIHNDRPDEKFERIARMTRAKTKGLSIFKCDQILIPINIDRIHWVLVAVVNPGHILHSYTDGGPEAHHLCPVLFYFDSLAHDSTQASTVLANLYRWLNWETKRRFDLQDLTPEMMAHLKSSSTYAGNWSEYPFTKKSMEVRFPRGMLARYLETYSSLSFLFCLSVLHSHL